MLCDVSEIHYRNHIPACTMGMSKIGTEMRLKNFCASFLMLPDEM